MKLSCLRGRKLRTDGSAELLARPPIRQPASGIEAGRKAGWSSFPFNVDSVANLLLCTFDDLVHTVLFARECAPKEMICVIAFTVLVRTSSTFLLVRKCVYRLATVCRRLDRRRDVDLLYAK